MSYEPSPSAQAAGEACPAESNERWVGTIYDPAVHNPSIGWIIRPTFSK
jgi:hypothetical protein